MDVRQLNFRRLFDTSTDQNERLEPGVADSDQHPGTPEKQYTPQYESMETLNEQSVGETEASLMSTLGEGSVVTKRQRGRRGSTLPNKVYQRRASLGVRCTTADREQRPGHERQESRESNAAEEEDSDPFDLLTRALRGQQLSIKGLWNQCGYVQHIEARRNLARLAAQKPEVPLMVGFAASQLSRNLGRQFKKSCAFKPLSSLSSASSGVSPLGQRAGGLRVNVGKSDPRIFQPAAEPAASSAHVDPGNGEAVLAPSSSAVSFRPTVVQLCQSTDSTRSSVEHAPATTRKEKPRGSIFQGLRKSIFLGHGPSSLGRSHGSSSRSSFNDDLAERRNQLASKMKKTRRMALAFMGMRPRSSLSEKVEVLAPNWTDVLLWAVIKGKHSLSRRLWEQTEEPLRAAIIITRVTRHMADNRKPQHSSGLSEAELWEKSDEYERWATGLLSRVPDDDAQLIMDLLTRAPMRSHRNNSGKPPILVWPNSVLDEATERAHPCMEFVAHPHCQSVLSDYWHGNYVGSRAAIPRGKLFEVLIQVIIKVICLNFPPRWLCFIKTERSNYSQPSSAVIDDAAAAADVSTEDDEFCRAYFSATARREMKKAHEGDTTLREGSVTITRNQGRRRAMSIIARTAMAQPPKLKGGSSHPTLDQLQLEDWKMEQWEEWWEMQMHFWCVPKVRFVVDAAFRLILLIIQVLLVIGHYYIREWMPSMLVPDSSGNYEMVSYVNGMRPPYMFYCTSRFVCETLAFILALARVAENLQSVHWSPFFFYSFMKAIDLFFCFSITATYIVRLVVSLVYYEEFHEYYGSSGAIDLLGAGRCTESIWRPDSCGRLILYSRVTSDVQAVNLFILTLTYLVTLAYNRALGHALTMLFAMIYDSTSTLFIIAWVSMGFGITTMALMPSLVGSVNLTKVQEFASVNGTIFPDGPFVNPETLGTVNSYQTVFDAPETNHFFMHPFFIGLYATITLMDVGLYQDQADSSENNTTVAAFVLFFFALFICVFCMNLLIARMASRYETINNSSFSHRRFQHIALIKRYKDEGPIPPFNLIVIAANFVIAALRAFPMTSRLAPKEKVKSRHHHFTVFSGAVASNQSGRIERSYLRDYVREDEARTAASRKEAEVVHQAVAQGMQQLRQELSEELDKLEGRLDGGNWRPPTRVRQCSDNTSSHMLEGSSPSPAASCSPQRLQTAAPKPIRVVPGSHRARDVNLHVGLDTSEVEVNSDPDA